MRNILTILSTVVLIFLLIGCENKTSNTTSSSSEASTPSQATSQSPTGFNKGKLSLNIGDITLLYDKREPGTGSLTKNKHLATFYTESEFEAIVWDVYSAKEFPDLSTVLVISGTNSNWRYKISERDSNLLSKLGPIISVFS